MTTVLWGLLVPGILLALLERSPRLRFRPLVLLRRHVLTDTICLVTGFLGGSGLTLLYLMAISRGLVRLGVPQVEELAVSPWILMPLAVVGFDAGQYGVHWMMHRFDVLWEFHKAHHSSLELDWLATFRSHLVEQALRRLIGILPLILVGVPPATIALAGAVYSASAMFNHSNLRLGPVRFGRVLVTPAFHRLHHVGRTTESNLGTILTVWDVLRGTATWTAAPGDVAFGLPGERGCYPQGWLGQLVYPFTALAARRGKARMAET